MSLNNNSNTGLISTLQSQIESTINGFLATISEKYNIDINELNDLCFDSKKKEKTSMVDMDDISPARIAKCNRTELSALCKHRGLKCSGKKEELVERLLSLNNSGPVEKKKEVKPVKATKIESIPVIRKVAEIDTANTVRLNSFGNYVHAPTRFVYDKNKGKFIGKQEDNGDISPFTDDDIDECKRYKLVYEIPNNLDSNSKTTKKIVELDDDDEDIEDIKKDSGSDEDEDEEDIEELEEDEEL